AGEHHRLVAALAVDAGEIGGKVCAGRLGGKDRDEAEAEREGKLPFPFQGGEKGKTACPGMTNATLTQLFTPHFHACAGPARRRMPACRPARIRSYGSLPRRGTGLERLVLRLK